MITNIKRNCYIANVKVVLDNTYRHTYILTPGTHAHGLLYRHVAARVVIQNRKRMKNERITSRFKSLGSLYTMGCLAHIITTSMLELKLEQLGFIANIVHIHLT